MMEYSAHPILIDIIFWLFSAGLVSYATITSAFRKGDPGVHGTDPYRGIDIRSWDQDDSQGLVDHVNNHWQYDSARPNMQCAILHNVGRGEHIHIQVHQNTVMIKGGW